MDEWFCVMWSGWTYIFSKSSISPNLFCFVILFFKSVNQPWTKLLLQHSIPTPNQQQQPLPSLLSDSYSMVTSNVFPDLSLEELHLSLEWLDQEPGTPGAGWLLQAYSQSSTVWGRWFLIFKNQFVWNQLSFNIIELKLVDRCFSTLTVFNSSPTDQERHLIIFVIVFGYPSTRIILISCCLLIMPTNTRV